MQQPVRDLMMLRRVEAALRENASTVLSTAGWMIVLIAPPPT
jgi:hypothetical protein